MGDNPARYLDYKKTAIGTYTKVDTRALRAQSLAQRRRSNRADTFSRNRDLEEVENLPENSIAPKERRILKLQQWKEKRAEERLKKIKNKKPEFKCGAVRHEDGHIYQDITAQRQMKSASTPQTPLAPANYKFKAPNTPGLRSAIRVTVPISPKVLGRSKKVVQLIHDTPGSSVNLPQPRMTRSRQKLAMQHDLAGLYSVNEVEPSNTDTISSQIARNTHVAIIKPQSKSSAKTSQSLQKFKLHNDSGHVLPPFQSKDNTSEEKVNRSDVKTKISENICVQSAPISQKVESKINEIICMPSTSQATPCLATAGEECQKSVKTPDFSRAVVTPVKTPDFSRAVVTPIAEELPINNSPFLTSSRGKKRSFRRSQLIDAAGGAGESERQQRTATYFRNILNEEVNRLKDLCKTWKDLQATAETDIPSDVDELIDVVVGQSNLLISKKLTQFRELINLYAKGTGQPKITMPDLQGFWDMVYLQVEDIDLRFMKLTLLHKNGWKESNVEVVETKPVTRSKRAGTKKAKPFNKTQSTLRATIEATRKRTRLAVDVAKENDCPELLEGLKTPGNPRLHSILKTTDSPRLTPTSINPSVLKAKTTSSKKMSQTSNILKSPAINILHTKQATLKSVNFEDQMKNSEAANASVGSTINVTVQEPSTSFSDIPKCRRSLRLSKRVHFQGGDLISTPKPSLPVTPHRKRGDLISTPKPSLPVTPHRKRMSSRLSSVDSANNNSPVAPLEGGDLISWKSPISTPTRSAKRLK